MSITGSNKVDKKTKFYHSKMNPKPINPLYKRKIDWTKIPLVGGFMDKKRSI